MNYGVQLFSLRKYLKDEAGYRSVFERVKAMGADVVQISSTMSSPIDAKTLAAISREYALPICVTHAPYERIVGDVDRLAEEHLQFGCREIGVGMMPKEFRADSFARLDEFIASLNTASEKLKAYGMNVAYHNHWFEFNLLNDNVAPAFGGNVKTVFDALICATSPDVKFIPDTFWIKVGGEDPAEFISRLSNRVDTVHLKDYKKTFGVPVFRALGKGDLNFDEILSASKEAGAQNAVVELDFSPNPYKSIAVSMDYLSSFRGKY